MDINVKEKTAKEKRELAVETSQEEIVSVEGLDQNVEDVCKNVQETDQSGNYEVAEESNVRH